MSAATGIFIEAYSPFGIHNGDTITVGLDPDGSTHTSPGWTVDVSGGLAVSPASGVLLTPGQSAFQVSVSGDINTNGDYTFTVTKEGTGEQASITVHVQWVLSQYQMAGRGESPNQRGRVGVA